MSEQITAINYQSFFLLDVLEKDKDHTWNCPTEGLKTAYLSSNLNLLLDGNSPSLIRR